MTETILISESPLATETLGRLMGRRIQPGTVLRLEGDLGCGKTCFVRGLAQGLDVDPAYDIISPTYTLINLYPGRLQLIHADLYRLKSPVDAEPLGLLDYWSDRSAVVAVEWAEKLHPADWPAASLLMRFTIENDTRRNIRLIGYGLAVDDLIKDAGHGKGLNRHPEYRNNRNETRS